MRAAKPQWRRKFSTCSALGVAGRRTELIAALRKGAQTVCAKAASTAHHHGMRTVIRETARASSMSVSTIPPDDDVLRPWAPWAFDHIAHETIDVRAVHVYTFCRSLDTSYM
eukprot:3559947-Prymnesium_polylepis.1